MAVNGCVSRLVRCTLHTLNTSFKDWDSVTAVNSIRCSLVMLLSRLDWIQLRSHIPYMIPWNSTNQSYIISHKFSISTTCSTRSFCTSICSITVRIWKIWVSWSISIIFQWSTWSFPLEDPWRSRTRCPSCGRRSRPWTCPGSWAPFRRAPWCLADTSWTSGTRQVRHGRGKVGGIYVVVKWGKVMGIYNLYTYIYIYVCVCNIWIDVKLLSFSFYFPLPC